MAKSCLRGADLAKANMSRVNISEANLSRTKLEGADLRGANMLGTLVGFSTLDKAAIIPQTWQSAEFYASVGKDYFEDDELKDCVEVAFRKQGQSPQN